MSRELTVSNEVIAAIANRPLGAELLAIVERIDADMKSLRATWNDADLQEIVRVVGKYTRIKIKKVRMEQTPYENAAVQVENFSGHSGRIYYGESTRPETLRNEKMDQAIIESTIDLVAGKIIGPMVDHAQITLYLTTALWQGGCKLTPREITAIILHEIGHAFNVFLTLGDYVWLNYYLSDGVQVVLGKKPNKYKLQVLTIKGLQNSITDAKDRAALEKDPTEANVRRALLTAFRTRQRHYLHSKETQNSRRRDEQLADLFASRMGFGKDLVLGLDKLERMWGGRWLRTNTSHMIAETAKALSLLLGVATIPFAGWGLIWIVITSVFWEPNETQGSMRYDNPTERLTKIRRDLIAQLKAFDKDPESQASLSEDIKAIDLLLNDYNQRRTVWEVLVQTFSGERRRQWQLKDQEQVLEGLMHNDLFLLTQRFDQLNKPRV